MQRKESNIEYTQSILPHEKCLDTYAAPFDRHDHALRNVHFMRHDVEHQWWFEGVRSGTHGTTYRSRYVPRDADFVAIACWSCVKQAKCKIV